MPVAVPIALAALSAAPSITKIIGGEKEKREAAELARIRQPKFRDITPEESALSLAKLNALKTQLPGQPLIENKIAGATANQIRNIQEVGSPVESIAAGSAAVGQQQDALANLGIAGAEMYAKNQDILRSEFKDFGNILSQKWDWEQRQPYLWAKQKEAALNKAGAENVQHGLEGIFGSVAGGVSLLDKQGVFDGTSGKTKNMTSPDSGTDTTNILNPASTTPPENYPFQNAFPTATPLETPNNMGDSNSMLRQQQFAQLKQMFPQYSDEQINQMLAQTYMYR